MSCTVDHFITFVALKALTRRKVDPKWLPIRQLLDSSWKTLEMLYPTLILYPIHYRQEGRKLNC